MDVKTVSMQEWALKYAKAGMSIIPVGSDKKPLVKWENYQKRIASENEIVGWWTKFPEANIAVVTGSISGKVVVDIDDPELKHDLLDSVEKYAEPPITTTPRGGRHLWFLNPSSEIRNTTSFIPKVDFRGEGGYVVVPPSNGNGKAYAWKNSIFDSDIPVLPDSLIKLINNNARTRTTPENGGIFEEKREVTECKQDVSTLTNAYGCLQVLTSGRRDEDLFHVANCLVKGGANDGMIIEVVKRLAASCNPPFPEQEAMEKIKSALNRTERKERGAAEEIKHWCMMQDGIFTVSDLCHAINLNSRQEKGVAYIAMNRLVKEKLIERFGNKSGCYRKIDNEVEEINWEDAPTHDLTIEYPLGIDRMVKTYPSNIVIVAGTSNSGKTTFLLDFARRNLNRYKISYFNSEMGASELKMRLNMFENCTTADWKKVKFFERSDNFDDVINPDGINIIDYLEVLDDFWKVGQNIKAIHDKLNTGVAIIAIQKNKGSELGRGGALGTEKCRLYINLEYGRVKLVKAKNWRTMENPNNMAKNFKIISGWKFIDSEGWSNE